MPITDKRISYIKELVNAIKSVKMYAWEKAFMEKIHSTRKEEVACLRKAAFVQNQAITVGVTITVTASVVTFIALS